VALGLIVTASAGASRGIRIQTEIGPTGIGSLMADTSSTTLPPLTWEACAPDLRSCRRFAGGRKIETTGAAPGTVFRVRDAGGGTGISPEWRGSPKALAPPKVVGIIQANESVSPVRGLWSGGWEGENSELQLSACATEAGEQCVALTDPHRIRWGCTSSDSFTLGPDLTGRYLRVADRQSGGPHIEPPYAVGPAPPRYEVALFRSGGDVWGRSRNTSVAIVGQIGPAVNPTAGECGPPPAPTATISRKGVARVECAAGCSAVLVGTRNGRRQLVTRHVSEHALLTPYPALELDLSRSALARLGAGKIRLTVEIDGALWVQRTIRTSASD
jgi:hypothetical protein